MKTSRLATLLLAAVLLAQAGARAAAEQPPPDAPFDLMRASVAYASRAEVYVVAGGSDRTPPRVASGRIVGIRDVRGGAAVSVLLGPEASSGRPPAEVEIPPEAVFPTRQSALLDLQSRTNPGFRIRSVGRPG